MKKLLLALYILAICKNSLAQPYLPLTGGTLTGTTVLQTDAAATNVLGVHYDGNNQRIALNAAGGSGRGYLGWNNAQTAGSNVANYLINGTAAQILWDDNLKFRIGASGTASNPITFTDAYILSNAGNHNFGTGTATFGNAVTAAGNVGIGTTSLDPVGYGYLGITIKGGTYGGAAGVLTLQTPTTDANGQNLGIIAFADGTNVGPIILAKRATSSTIHDLLFYTGGGETARITNGGNVGIGTASPSEKLAVNGKIRAKEIKVETGWSDFVFEPSYKLRSLKETEQFIKKE